MTSFIVFGDITHLPSPSSPSFFLSFLPQHPPIELSNLDGGAAPRIVEVSFIRPL